MQRTRKGDEDARFLTLGTIVRHARLPTMRGVVVAWRRARDVAGWGTVDIDGPASATTLTDQPSYDVLCDNGTRVPPRAPGPVASRCACPNPGAFAFRCVPCMP